MKKKIALIALVTFSVFSLIIIGEGSNEVYACEITIPDAELPQPCE